MAPATPSVQLARFMAKFTPAMAKEGRAALMRLRRLVPGAVQMVYDNWNGLVVGFGPTERPSEAVVSIIVLPDHVSVCFIQDAPDLPDPKHLLQGSGNVVRHIKLTSRRAISTSRRSARSSSTPCRAPTSRSIAKPAASW